MTELEERIVAGVISGIVSGVIVAFVMYQLFGKEASEVVVEQTEVLKAMAEAQGVPVSAIKFRGSTSPGSQYPVHHAPRF